MNVSGLAGWENGGGRLSERLGRALERALVSGALGDGPLPSERRLADALGVSRGTVTAAYAELKERRLIASRPGGYTQPDLAALAAPARAARLAARGMVDGTILEHYVARDPAVLDLTFAFLDAPDTMRATIRAAYENALDREPRTEYVAAGLPELRERIAAWYTTSLHLRTSADQIVVTQGAYQAIGLITLMTCSQGDVVAVEPAIYPGALDLFHAYSASMRVFGCFDDTSTLDALEGAPSPPALVYASSAYRNPSGTAMAASRAARLARWSARADVTVIDDRALELCGFDGPVPRPLAAYAPDAPILTLGSLDKATGAATRIGWVRAPRALAPKVTRLKALTDLASPPYMQRVAIRLTEHLDAFARARRAELGRRYATIASRVRACYPHWRWDAPGGGASMWVDTGIDSAVFARAAARGGVELITGAGFRPDGASGTCVRLAFARPEPYLIAAVERLDRARTHLPRPRISARS